MNSECRKAFDKWYRDLGVQYNEDDETSFFFGWQAAWDKLSNKQRMPILFAAPYREK